MSRAAGIRLAGEFAIDARVSCVEALSARSGLHDYASSRRADLLVVSASNRDEVGRLLLGDDTNEVLDGAPCVVAVAPNEYFARGATIRRIGVGYDASAASERALALACASPMRLTDSRARLTREISLAEASAA